MNDHVIGSWPNQITEKQEVSTLDELNYSWIFVMIPFCPEFYYVAEPSIKINQYSVKSLLCQYLRHFFFFKLGGGGGIILKINLNYNVSLMFSET